MPDDRARGGVPLSSQDGAARMTPDETIERYRSLFTHNPHAALSFDLEGRFVDVNPVAVALSGYTRDELCSMHFMQLLDDDDLPGAMTAFHAALNRSSTQLDARMFEKSGAVRELSITVLPVVVGGAVVGVHGIAEDVTERNELARELESARRVAEEANASKSVFLANISHEVRTPLTSVLAAAEMLHDAPLDPACSNLVDMIERSGERLLRLIGDILDFSKLERGTIGLEESVFCLRQTIQDATIGAAPDAARRGIDLTWAVDDSVPEQLVGDSGRITQVLTNLVDNAVKFTERGGVQVTAELSDRTSTTVDVVCNVVDSGIGIPAEQIGILFESFTQADGSDTRAYGGAGLGLAICRELVALLGGSIKATSLPGSGSSFAVSFPLRLVATTPRTD